MCKQLLIELYETCDTVEEMVEQLRSLETSGEITEEQYDYLTQNWDNILKGVYNG